MVTNIAINDALINEAIKIGGHKTKKDAVNTAFQEYIQNHKQLKILELFGTINYDENYDYKKRRSKE